ncbi:MAG: serine/threonine-protein kinase [Phycisphaerales bacterium]|nr:serine/threonine-protein kinase [Phycisphaerales bacterium]
MNSTDHSKVVEIFLAACELSEDQRVAYLEQACGSNLQLRTEVEELLAHDRTRAVVDEPVVGSQLHEAVESAVTVPQSRPSRIDKYEILDVLGEGGMGTVYKARQSNPNRMVALKIIRPGLSSKSLIRRFEQEAHVLGQLQDPGIAQIFEAGAADTGHGPQPFFAMELIDGLPLTDYAGKRQLSIRPRLELMTRVCDAVHHAHQKGIIHRDLKPANILVVDKGAKGPRVQGVEGKSLDPQPLGPSDPFFAQPKILDFGVARATDSDIKTTTLQTDVGQLIGTIPYMSPEQVAGDPSAVDVRSDVYALGVICYELLTGQLPHDLHNKTIPEAARVIQDEDPASLSSINRFFRGDVDTIVAKALEKEKARRYQSAEQLAADIRRYLRDEPIIARPASAAYQFRKFARRHRALVWAAASVFVSLVVAFFGILGYAIQAGRAEVQAKNERDIAVAIQKQLEQANTKIEREKAKTVAINAFLIEMLASANPFRDTGRGGRDVTVLTMLNQAAEQIKDGLPDEPDVEAIVRTTIGETYNGLGQYEDAARHLQIALDLNQRLYGEKHQNVGKVKRLLATTLGKSTGDYKKSVELLEEALALQRELHGEEHKDIARTMSDLGWVLERTGNPEQAAGYYRKSLEMNRKLWGDEHEKVSSGLNNLAHALSALGKNTEAEALYQEALERFRRQFGDQHPNVGYIENNLGKILYNKGNYEAAERKWRSAVESLQASLGDRHPMVGRVLNNLASALHEQRKYEEAEIEYEKSVETYRTAFGENHPDYVGTINNLTYLYWDQGRYAKAAETIKSVADFRRTRHGARFWRVALTDARYGECLVKLQRYDEAADVLIESYSILKDYTADRSRRIRSLVQSRFKAGEKILLGAYEELESRRGDQDGPTQSIIRTLQALYHAHGRPDKAAEFQAE